MTLFNTPSRFPHFLLVLALWMTTTTAGSQSLLEEITDVQAERVTQIQLEGISLDRDIWTEDSELEDGALNVRFGNWVGKQSLTTCEVRDSKGVVLWEEDLLIGAGVEVQFEFEGLLRGEYTMTAIHENQRASLFFSVNGAEVISAERSFSGLLNIYPNPIRGRQLNIEIGGWIDDRTLTALRITDLFGQALIDKTMRLQPNVLTRLDVSSLEAGEYILIVVNDRERHTQRFTISR